MDLQSSPQGLVCVLQQQARDCAGEEREGGGGEAMGIPFFLHTEKWQYPVLQ